MEGSCAESTGTASRKEVQEGREGRPEGRGRASRELRVEGPWAGAGGGL